jgi:predicted small secreted protein
MKKIVAILGVLALLAGCNTVKGVGQDLQRAGEKLEEATKKK